MSRSSGRPVLGLAFLLLLASAHAIRVRSAIKATKSAQQRVRGAAAARHAVQAAKSWNNPELVQLNGQVKTLSLHLGILDSAVADQSVPDIKAAVAKLTQEVHNCKDTFSRFAEFSGDATPCSSEDESGGAECVSPEVLKTLSDSVSTLFGDPFLDKIPDYLGVYSQSEDSTVQQIRNTVADAVRQSQPRDDADSLSLDSLSLSGDGPQALDVDGGVGNGHHHHHHHPHHAHIADVERLAGTLSTLDVELVKNEGLLTKTAGHSDTGFLESGVLVRQGQAAGRQAVSNSNSGSTLVQGFMKLIVNTALVAFLFPFFVAFLFVFAVIYSVASFLGLTFLTKAGDTAVMHALKKVNEGLNAVVPEEGIKIGEVRRRGVGRHRQLYIN